MNFEEERIVFKSSNGIYKVHGKIVKPINKEIKGIIQISHGMCEYIDKYDDFAEVCLEKGYVVVGHDHIGHGDSINKDEDRGFFGKKDGYKAMIEDLKKVTDIVKNKYPNTPIYMLSHSMGSFIARCYVAKYGEEIDGLIICGTIGPQALANAGIKFANFLVNQKGERYRSRILYNLALDFANVKRIPAKTRFDWVSSSKEEIESQLNDSKSNFIFTARGFVDLFHLVSLSNSKMVMKTVPKDLDMFFISGGEDPIGEYGAGVKRAIEWYKEMNISKIDLKIYPGKRHGLLKETNKEEIFEDIFNWIEKIR